MTAASVALWSLLAGPSRPARVLEIDAGTVYLRVDPLPAAESRDGRDHPGAVLALLAPDAVRLPIGLRLPAAAADLVPVSVAGAPVSRGEITIGWGAITLAEVRWPILDWWNPGIPALELPARSITADSVPEPSDHPDRAEAQLPAGPPELAEGLVALAGGLADEAVRQLAGVGAGPVPAGDDVLSGALAALAAWAPDSPARQALATATAAAVAAERTTPVSAALLQSAVTGFAVPEVVGYLTALSTPGADVDRALAELTAIDVGSGAAVALGVLHELRALHSGNARTAA